MFRKTGKIIQKNMKIILRRNASVFVILLLPLILMFLLGLVFSGTHTYYISVGVYSPSYGDLTDSIIDNLKSDEFSITKYPLEEACIDGVKSGEANVCLVFPEGNRKLANGAKTEIVFHVDYLNINLVYNIIDSLSATVSQKSEELSEAMAQDLITRLASAEIEVNKRVPMVVRLTNDNDDMFSSTKSAVTDLQGLDLEFNEQQFSVSDINHEFDYWKELASRTLFESNLLLAEIENQVSTLGGNTSEIDELLRESGQKFEDYEEQLENANASLEKLMENMSSAISETKRKFMVATTVRDNATVRMDEIKGTLEESMMKLNNIQAGMNNIKKSVSAFGLENATDLVNPIETLIEPISEKKTHFNYIFPVLIVLIMLVTGILLGSTFSMAEKNSSAYFRNITSPTSNALFVFGLFMTALIIMVLQVILSMLIAGFFFNIAIWGSLFPLLIGVMLVSSVFILFGIFISSFFRSQLLNALASMALAISLLLFSNIILPLESMPMVFRNIASFNPVIMGNNLIKEIIFYSFTISDVSRYLIILLIYCVVLFILSILMQKSLRLYMLYHIHKLPTSHFASGFRDKLRRIFRKNKTQIVDGKKPTVKIESKPTMENVLLKDAEKSVTVEEKIQQNKSFENQMEKSKEIDLKLQRLKNELKKL